MLNVIGDLAWPGGSTGSGGDTNTSPSLLFYCGVKANECRCGACDGQCGPFEGCPCNACVQLCGFEVNSSRRLARRGFGTGSGGDTRRLPAQLWYCGGPSQCRCRTCSRAQCGPNDGCPCLACLQLAGLWLRPASIERTDDVGGILITPQAVLPISERSAAQPAVRPATASAGTAPPQPVNSARPATAKPITSTHAAAATATPVVSAQPRPARPASAVPTPTPAEVRRQAVQAVLDKVETHSLVLLNQYRTSLGLPRMAHASNLAHAARLHAQSMASGAVPFSHQDFTKRLHAAGYRGGAENCAALYTEHNDALARDPVQIAVTLFENLQKSEGHDKNLRGKHALVGIGYAMGPSGWFEVQMFSS